LSGAGRVDDKFCFHARNAEAPGAEANYVCKPEIAPEGREFAVDGVGSELSLQEPCPILKTRAVRQRLREGDEERESCTDDGKRDLGSDASIDAPQLWASALEEPCRKVAEVTLVFPYGLLVFVSEPGPKGFRRRIGCARVRLD